ncbi:MAG: triacylglycerol lipase superfamily [Rhodospirillaceae bacterium]|nr:MAG: triacylglycerol lipase superfamily [Rhodospirillaceae bacterium]TNC94959.1 MAG: triacylglycerol lipase superfamily protein [Stygiobacter sp.]
MATYDLTQTVFLFNFLSNAASNVSGDAQQLAGFLQMAVTNGGRWYDAKTGNTLVVNGFIQNMNAALAGGDWRLEWGPGVFQQDGDEAQNTLFVVYSPSLDTYVVAMAGTNPHSVYDWLVEDASVGPQDMAVFPVASGPRKPDKVAANQSQVQVSHGTAIGIHNLLTGLVDSNGDGLDLKRFLSSLKATSGSRMIFTGHSLGGALSSTLALQMYLELKTNWRDNGGAVLALPTAGPSPGNATFAGSWGDVFTPVAVPATNTGNQVTNLNVLVYDTQDVVPHAWDFILSLDSVPTNGQYPNPDMPSYFYDHAGLIKQTVQTQLGQLSGLWVKPLWQLVQGAQDKGTGGYMKRLPNAAGLTGSFPLTYWSSKKLDWQQWSPPTNNVFDAFAGFGEGLGLVHVWQYHQFFAIDPQDIVRTIEPAT